MSGSNKAKQRYGLLLSLPGAPNAPHQVIGLPGLFRPDVPTPVGGEGDTLTLDKAKKFLAEFEENADAAHAKWDEFEAEQVEKGLRDNGPLEFVRPEPPVELVEIKPAAVKKAEEQRDEDVAASRNAVSERTRELRLASKPAAAEVEQVQDEAAAVAGKE